MLVTTYQHDYLPPFTQRYNFLNSPKGNTKEKVECQCIDDVKVEPPKKAVEQCAGVEWTSIAPMGRLVEPRLIPAKFTPGQLANMARSDPNDDCMLLQPNRFLKILRTAYPDLYERLKQMPKDEINRRIDRERLFTTYQIDYCNLNEYPEGVYESMSTEEGPSKLNDSKLLQLQGPCSEFRTNVMQELGKEVREGRFNDPCQRAYRPFKITFGDSNRTIPSGNFSHWRVNGLPLFSKRANFSEYVETISKNGCMIMKNNIHDHSKCLGGAHCRHKLVETCSNLKKLT